MGFRTADAIIVLGLSKLATCARELQFLGSLLLWVWLTACARTKEGAPKATQSPPQRGDRVLVESSAAEFYEAQVLESTLQRLKVQSLGGGNLAHVQVGNVYRLPSTSGMLADRAYAICNIANARWVGCRVTKAHPGIAQFEDARGGAYQLPWSRVLVPGALTELNLKRQFDRAAAGHDFEREMARAGKPPKIAGWSPISGKSVLVQTDTQWNLATVLSERRGVVRLRIFGTRHELEASPDMLAPEPPYPLEILKRSRLALLRPVNQTDAWRPIRLVSADSLECIIEDEAGRRSAPVRDVCPLENR